MLRLPHPLLQVRCHLQPAEEGLTSTRPAYYIYLADVDRILQDLRAPHCLQHVRDRMGDSGEEGEAILEILLENGRLRRVLSCYVGLLLALSNALVVRLKCGTAAKRAKRFWKHCWRMGAYGELRFCLLACSLAMTGTTAKAMTRSKPFKRFAGKRRLR